MAIKADQSPFCEIPSSSLMTDDGDRIHYDWHEPIEVWLPHDFGESPRGGWSLRVCAGDIQDWPLADGVHATDMVRCRIDLSQFLGRLQPGLHQLEITISRQGRKPEFIRQLWFWAGLEVYEEGTAFRFASPPRNLLRDECQGFVIGSFAIKHKRTDSPRHTLTFNVNGTARQFHWTQAGDYLESFEKQAGQMARFQAHQFGDTFSASIDSFRYLRIWQIPALEFQVLVNHQQVQFMPAASARPWLDLSLAHFSTLFPSGGEIVLRSNAQEVPIARFTRPLTPIHTDETSGQGRRCLKFGFPDDVGWVRPRVREIISGQAIELEGKALDSSGSCEFSVNPVPPIERGSRATEWLLWQDGLDHVAKLLADQGPSVGVSEDCREITLSVPESGWPSGLWFIELEVRRSEMADWQVVTTADGALIPLLLAGSASEVGNVRQHILWAGYEAGRMQPPAPLDLAALTPSSTEAYELLAEVSRLVERGFASEVKRQFGWLEHLFHELGRFTGKTLTLADKQYTAKLLNLACIETGQVDGFSPAKRSLFVTVPELLALPADHCADTSASHAIGQALRWCSRLAAHDLVFDAFRDLIAAVYESPGAPVPDFVRVLQNFRNFTQLLQPSDPRAATDDFAHFDYNRYFSQTIGEVQESQPQPEWDERSALGRAHVEWALSKFAERRRACVEDQKLGAVNALLDTAPSFRNWLRHALDSRLSIMPGATWNQPWLAVSFDNDDLMENCCRFASMFALSARAAGAGWFLFEDVIVWLTEQGAAQHADEATIATLVGMAPELFGYYLMFWELMIRTYPHV